MLIQHNSGRNFISESRFIPCLPLTTVLSPLSLRKTNLFTVEVSVKVALAQKGSTVRAMSVLK